MKRWLYASSISALLLVGPAVFAQTAKLIDQYETIPCDDYLSRMDALRDLSGKEPHSRIYVILYDGSLRKFVPGKDEQWIASPRGLVKARIRSMKKYLDRFETDLSRFVFIDGGFREHAGVDVWLVPSGGKEPLASPTVKTIKHSKGRAAGFCTWCC
jgi:hypothetical protein